MGLAVIIDDADPQLIYYGAQWVHVTSSNSQYNGTISVCQLDPNATTPSSLPVSFYGSDINLYGPVISGVGLNYSIDGSTMRPALLNTTAVGKNGVDIWNLKALDSGILTVYHNIQLLPSAGQFTFDFLTFTPNQYTGLAKRRLIIDDTDASLQYSGNWVKSSGNFNIGVPYNGTMSSSNVNGSSLTFDFVGSSISVFGLLNQVDGTLSASFSVDGKAATANNLFNGSQTVNASSWTLWQQFYHEDLVPGNHSVVVTLNQVTGSQALYLDSLVFEGTSSTPLNTSSSSSSSTTNTSSSTPSSGTKLSNATISGIVVGVIIMLALFPYIRRKVNNSFRMNRNPNSDFSRTYASTGGGAASQCPPVQLQPDSNAYRMSPAQMAMMSSGHALDGTSNYGPILMPYNSAPDTARPPQVPQVLSHSSSAQPYVPSMSMPMPQPVTQPPSSLPPPSSPPPPPAQTTQSTPVPSAPHRQQTQDAGPADLPPPYDEALYIP